MINNFWTQGYPAELADRPNNPLLYSIDPHLKTPMMQQWHLGRAVSAARRNRVGGFLCWLARTADSMVSTTAIRRTPSADPNAPLAPRRPFPAVDGTIDTFRSNTFSNYNSLQAQLEKRRQPWAAVRGFVHLQSRSGRRLQRQPGVAQQR